MAEIAKEEKDYAQYPLPKFYNFPSVEARERILYANFQKVNQEVKDMIAEIQEFYKKWGKFLSIQSNFTHKFSNLYCCQKEKSCNFVM